MSEADVFAKLRWYQLRAMESPLGSEERGTWTAILRDLEEFKNRLTTASTVAIQTIQQVSLILIIHKIGCDIPVESKIRYVLRHKNPGQYFSDTPEKKTKSLFNAKRFPSEDYYNLWLSVSPHRPDKPDEFELIPIKMTIEEDKPNGELLREIS